ncbi:MAG: HEAT repeat domain-containing protein, partial [bacterium]
GGFDAPAATTVMRGLEGVISQRQAKLKGDSMKLLGLFNSPAPETAAAALRLAGALKVDGLLEPIKGIASNSSGSPTLRLAATEALSHFPNDAARDALLAISGSDAPAEVKRAAALA